MFQVQGLEDHRRHLAGLRELLPDGAEVESVVTQERLRVLQENMDELDSQTTMLATVADMLAQTGEPLYFCPVTPPFSPSGYNDNYSDWERIIRISHQYSD